MKKQIVCLYSIVHFLVDLSCAILVLNFVSQNMGQTVNYFIAVIVYNLFAFAVELPIGIIADKVNKNGICAAIGCVLVALAYAFTGLGLVACIIAGLGNAMFHIGAGIDVLNISDKKASLSGIFVSTGALGIYLGTNSLSWGFSNIYIMPIILIIFSVLILLLYSKIKDKVINEETVIPKLNKNEIIAIICLVITVCIRSYVGMILSFEWKSKFILALLSILAVIFGKMLGGIIGDKIGFKKISIISLGISAILYIFAFNNSIIGILAILLFNMTMPITLTALSNMLYNNKGMAFGALTLALFVGALPVFFGYTKAIFTPVGLFAITAISLIILCIGIDKYNMSMEKRK